MTSRELIRRIVEFDHPERIGWDFIGGPSDLRTAGIRWEREGRPEEHRQWGYHPKLLAQVPHFRGMVYEDEWGNIWGRLDGASKGEVIRGVLEEGYHKVDQLNLPCPAKIDVERLRIKTLRDILPVGGSPGSPSTSCGRCGGWRTSWPIPSWLGTRC